MQAGGFLNYRLKYCWPKVIYCACQPNELKREIRKKLAGATKNLGGHGPTKPLLRIATCGCCFSWKRCCECTPEPRYNCQALTGPRLQKGWVLLLVHIFFKPLM